ncbi:MAG TPA: hypothetical protein VGO59_19435 [Verrucomicrobiae bacterium]
MRSVQQTQSAKRSFKAKKLSGSTGVTCKNGSEKNGSFCRKTGVWPGKNDAFACRFSFFREFSSRKPLRGNNIQSTQAFQKNHAKNTTVGFLLFVVSATIFP